MGVNSLHFFDSGGLGQPFSSLFSAELASGIVTVSPLFGLDQIDQKGGGEVRKLQIFFLQFFHHFSLHTCIIFFVF